MKNILTLLIVILGVGFILTPRDITQAKQGCCSHHKGVAYCGSNGYYICNDGVRSPSCTCGSSYTNSYTNSYSNTYPNSYTNSLTNSFTNTYSNPSYNNNSLTYSYTNTYVDKGTECKNKYGSDAYYSFYDGKCTCGYGYVLNTLKGVTRCLTYDENCQAMHGDQAYHVGNSTCGCRNGYKMVNWKCVSQDEECKKTYGDKSYYNNSTQSCTCNSGYMLWKGKCISETDSCQIQYGTKSIAGETGYCKCVDGYVRNNDKTQCITKDQYYCGGYGSNVHYNTYDNMCYCKDGFEWNSEMTKCIAIKKKGNCNKFGLNSYMDEKGNCKCLDGYKFSPILDECVKK